MKQQFDKNGILFIDEDPKDFVYILRCINSTYENTLKIQNISGHYAMLQMYPLQYQRRQLITFLI